MVIRPDLCATVQVKVQACIIDIGSTNKAAPDRHSASAAFQPRPGLASRQGARGGGLNAGWSGAAFKPNWGNGFDVARARVTRVTTWIASCSLAARWLVAAGGPLKERTARSGIWLVLGDAVSRLAGLAKLVMLSRMLAPGDFGLLGVALLVQTWLSAFTETGMNAALIQKKEDICAYLNTAWSLQLARGLGVAVLLFMLAPLGALFFGNPQVMPIIRATAPLELMWALVNPAVVHLRRDLDFRRDVIWRLSGVLPGLIVGVALALVYRNVWALMFSLLAARLAEVVASYWIHPYRPRLAFDWLRARELMRFGKWVWWVNVGGFLERQMDSLAAGKLLGTAFLGYYQVAQQVANYPTAQVGTYAGGVLFPAFSRAGDIERLRRAFLSALSLILLVVLPAALFLSAFAEPLVRVGLGARWLLICPSLRILAWAGVTSAVAGVTSAAFLGSGHPRNAAVAQGLKVALLAILIVPLANTYGLMGIAISVLLSSVASVVVQLALAARLLKTGIDLLSCMRPAVLCFSLFGLAWFVGRATAPWVLYLATGIAGVAYVGTMIKVVRSHLLSAPIQEQSSARMEPALGGRQTFG